MIFQYWGNIYFGFCQKHKRFQGLFVKNTGDFQAFLSKTQTNFKPFCQKHIYIAPAVLIYYKQAAKNAVTDSIHHRILKSNIYYFIHLVIEAFADHSVNLVK